MKTLLLRHRRLVLGALLLAVVAIGLSLISGSRTKPPPVVDQRPPRQEVAGLGRIEPVSEVIHLGSAEANRLQTLLVVRGQHVEKGQVLGTLSAHDVHVAEAAQSQAAIEVAELKLRQAQDVAPLNIAAQQSTIAALESELTNNRDILNSLNELRRKEATTRRSRDDQEALVLQGEARLKAAKDQFDAMVGQQKLDVDSAKASIASAKADLARAQATVGLATLTSPVTGTVLNILAVPGDDVTNKEILTLGDTSVMRAVAEIYETDIHAVHLGQSATVSSPALPRPLTGKVVEIGHIIYKNDVLSVDPAAKTDARVVEVRVQLDDADAVKDLTNLTVDVVIDTKALVASAAPSGK